MPWPATSIAQPNFDTGPGQAVPTSPTVVVAGNCWMLGAHFTNRGSTQQIVTVTDTAGGVLCEVTIGAGQEQPYEWPFRPANGVKWSADGAGCVGQIWGYTA